MRIEQEIITSNTIINFESGAYAVSIQALPGTTFVFNDQTSPNSEITMGPSGIYSLNLNDPWITSINFLNIVGDLPVILDYVLSEGSEEEQE